MATGLDAQHKIFASNPDDRRAFEALEEHFFLSGEWDALVQLYRDRVAAPSVEADDALRTPLLFRLGQILEDRVLDLDAAAEVFWDLARIDPTNRPALRQLRGIHERRSQWDMVLQIAELESATSMPPYERAAFEAELGRTWKQHLDDASEAQAAYERALEADPDFPSALEGLAALHREAGRLDEAAATLERLTVRLRGPERAPAWIALGTLYAGPLGRKEDARSCFAKALEDDPFQAPAVEWALLLATETEDWPAVSELLESRFDLASGARHRAAIAVEASQIQLNHLGSPASARAWVDRAIDLGAEEPAVLLAASDVERCDGDREALLHTLDRLIDLTGDRAPRNALIESAELHAEFGESEEALAALRHITNRFGSGDERVLVLQARLLRDRGAREELADVLETLIALDSAAPEIRADRHRELARLQEQELGQEDEATLHWRRAFDLEPKDATSLDALDRLYRKHDQLHDLRDVLQIALDAAGSAPPASLLARLGELLLEVDDDPERAQTLFERAIEIDPESRPARAGLRALAEASGDPDLVLSVCTREAEDCRDGHQMGELARRVMPILEARDDVEAAHDWALRWSRLAPEAREAFEHRADYEARLERPEDEIESRRALARLQTGRDRSQNLERQAALLLELGRTLDAAQAFEQALEIEPGRIELLTSLGTIYRELERPQDLVRTLRPLAEVQRSDEQAETLEELATILEDPLGDLDTAIVVRWRLVELEDAPAEAAHKLETLLDMSGRYSELAHLCFTLRQRLADGSPEAFELDLRRATLLLDPLGHCDEAAEILGPLSEQNPESREIAGLLERALRSGDDAAGLCQLLERKAGWTEDANERAEIDLERARLLEEALGETAEACDLLEAILGEFGESESDAAVEADRRLEALLESTAQWGRLRDHLLSRAESLPPVEQIQLREQLATLCRDRLHDVAACAEQLEFIADTVTDRVHVWQQLEEIYGHQLDRPADWLRVVRAELECDPEPEREFMLRVGAARLCLDRDRRPRETETSEAYAHYERVIALEPGHPEASEVLALHYTNEGREADTLRILDGRLARLADRDDEEATELRLRVAHLLAEVPDEAPRARELFERVLETIGPVAAVAEPLADLYQRTEAYEAQSLLAHAVLDAADAEGSPLVWRMRLAASERALGRFEEAAVAYRAALVDSPDDREIEDALIELYEQLGETEPLAEILEKRLPYARFDETVELRWQLAKLHAEGRDDPTEALVHLEKILETHPQHRDAFARALELAEATGDHERLLSLLDRLLAQAMPADERAETLERRARLLADQLASPDQAVVSLREALSLDRTRTSARVALRAMLEQLGRWPAVLDCLFVEAMEADDARRSELFEEAAELAWTRVGPDASLPWLARLREERPEDPELLARVAEVHRRAGRFEAALRALDQELALRSDPDECRELHLQRARLLERELHAPSRAIQAYREALEHGDAPAEILVELDRLYDLTGRAFERVEILEARIELLDGEARTELRRNVSTLLCVDLARPERAIPHLVANVDACRSDPQDELAALGALDTALRACGRHDAWVGVAERELELIEAHPAIAQATPTEFQRYLRAELAKTYDEVMGDSERALGHLRVLCANTGEAEADPQLRAQLRDLLRRNGHRNELARELATFLESGDRDDPRKAGAWLELARLREEVLHDLRGARAAFRAAENDPDQRLQALRGQRRTSERLRDWPAVASALDSEFRLENELGRAERTSLARSLGALHWERLSDPDRACEAYQRALDLDPQDFEALRAMTLIKEACSDPAGAVSLYREELERLGDEGRPHTRRREVWLRIARLSAEQCDAPRDAIEAYREAARLGKLTPSDELRLARLLESSGDDAFCETFGSWCDREDSGSTAADHLELARAWVQADEPAKARARCERATAVAPESAEAWSLLADLERQAGSVDRAAAAYERAAEHAAPIEAATHLVSASECVEEQDAERARTFLLRALELDPATLPAHAALTRIAHRLERPEESERSAERALELASSDALDDAQRLEIALLGGRAARQLEHRETSRRLYALVLAIEPENTEALEGVGLAHFADGDYAAARIPLERHLELESHHPDRALHLAIVARGLEAEEHLDAAWTRFEEAIEFDRDLSMAHEGLVRVHERAGRPAEALRALTRWSDASEDPEVRGLTAYRAAEHALALGDKQQAFERLERAVEADPTLAPAWVMACDLAAERGPDSDVRALCERALAAIEPGEHSARISMRAARLAEIAGETEAARSLYAETTRWDVRANEAALCESRLARMSGDWVEAEAVLSRFLENHPDHESPTLAQVYLERGRLLSGPLEDFDSAVGAYESALALQPQMAVARTALAGLLLHTPGRWREALALHREILAAQPTTAQSLRAISQIAAQRGATDVAGGAISVLRALGLASPQEESDAPMTFRFPIHPGPPMVEVDAERLRRLAHQVREELIEVLPAAPPTEVDASVDPTVADALHQIEALEDEISATGLARLDPEERGALFSTLAALFLDPGGNGQASRFQTPLDEALGRWTRRKVRRIVEETTLAEIEALDHKAWGDELRAMAAAQVVDRNGGDLRCVLRALILLDCEGDEAPAFESASIGTLAASSEPARRLLTRITTLLCDRLERSR